PTANLPLSETSLSWPASGWPEEMVSVDNFHHQPDHLWGSLIQLVEHGAVHQAGAKIPDDTMVIDAS
ncbi:hypothetical protein, partial [Klebsiella pneumoniae]|uniref:hypothetical protein n=1 Tax=Klebsiella pneumoniae TaxID=573 RepID=UPI0039C288CC